MYRNRSLIAVLCSALVLMPAGGFAADAPAPQQSTVTQSPTEEPHGILERIERPYKAREVAPINVSNTNRIEQLLRAGNLYLSLQDTIALDQSTVVGPVISKVLSGMRRGIARGH